MLEVPALQRTYSIRLLLACVIALLAVNNISAQNAHVRAIPTQSAASALANLPEADALIYVSPQRILNDAAPKVMAPTDLLKMGSAFDDLKKSVGVEPSTIESLVIAVRFHKPAADLRFVAPDVLITFGGDFSSDSLLTTAKLYLQDKLRDEKYGSKTLTIMKVDEIATAAVANPLLKSYVELGAVPLTSNSIAIGNLNYLQAAVDAADGKGRISASAIDSLLRDPNVLMSASGSPLTAFVKSLGLLGTETTPRESRCDTRFGDFYAAITMSGTNFSLRGAMNADNPDTAKIINGLFSGLWSQVVDSVPDKNAQLMLKTIKMNSRENEVVWEADIADQTVANFIKEQTKPAVSSPATADKKPATRPVTRRRRPKK